MKQRRGIKLCELQQHRPLFSREYHARRRKNPAEAFKQAARTVLITKVHHG